VRRDTLVDHVGPFLLFVIVAVLSEAFALWIDRSVGLVFYAVFYTTLSVVYLIAVWLYFEVVG
jgi:hypothetical protein